MEESGIMEMTLVFINFHTLDGGIFTKKVAIETALLTHLPDTLFRAIRDDDEKVIGHREYVLFHSDSKLGAYGYVEKQGKNL